MKRVTKLEPHQIFVFGSNTRGVHGAGAAKDAARLFGAAYGVGVGMTGQCYALPTKDTRLRTLSLREIQNYVEKFLALARTNPQFEFIVTPIGCGLAGYKPEQIAPMFKGYPANCIMPEEFIPFL